MPFNLKIQGFYFVITDTSNSSDCIREKTVQVKFKVNGNIYKFFLDQKNNVGSPTSYQLGKDNEQFDYNDIIDNRTGLAFVSNSDLTDFLSDILGEDCSSSGSGVKSVTGDGVGGTSADPILTFPTPAEIGAKVDFTENTAFNKDFGTSSGEVQNAGTYDPNGVRC